METSGPGAPQAAVVSQITDTHASDRRADDGEREMPCPVCGHPMPDLKGGKASICPVCGYKDSCCY